jgi:hypothetical protein
MLHYLLQMFYLVQVTQLQLELVEQEVPIQLDQEPMV